LGIENASVNSGWKPTRSARRSTVPLTSPTPRNRSLGPPSSRPPTQPKAIRRLVDLWTEKNASGCAERVEAERLIREERSALPAPPTAPLPWRAQEAPEVEQVVLPPTAPAPIPGLAEAEAGTQDVRDHHGQAAAHFHGNAELVAILQKLADRAVKAIGSPRTATTRICLMSIMITTPKPPA
jgi:hypothetical protein